ncbi:hypothetical protein IH779_01025 [Patescibacteria group bacterium]|nr:hypothetical protein [Patescibacteria group bacterium]
MTKKTRFILFSFLVILFLLIAPTIIFYSQGYRFNFDEKKIVRTGGVYLKVQPRGAQIYIDGKLVKKTDFLFGQALIDNLLPNKHKIEVKKSGYFPWMKNLAVQEQWVTETKNIFLVLQNPKFNILNNEVKDFFFSPDLKKILLKKESKKGWSLNLLNLEKNTEAVLLNEKEAGENLEFYTIQWSDDSKKILLNLTNEEYVIFDADEEKLTSLDFLGRINQVFFDPKNSQKIFFVQDIAKKNNLFSTNYLKRETLRPILKDFVTYQVANNNFFWLEKSGIFYISNSAGEKIDTLNLDPIHIKPESQYQLIVISPGKIFLKEGNILYYLNQDKKILEKISEGIKETKTSPDFKKMAYFTDYEIWIIFLEKITSQPQKEKGEKLFLTRFSEKIGDVFWWTSHYLVFNVGNSINIIEIDERDNINMYTLAEFPTPKIFWNKDNKILYILSNGNLYFSQKLY